MKFIVVHSFDDYISAHIIMGRLKEEYINCHLQDEHTITTSPFLSNITGGIKLMAPESQAERAIELLQEFEKGRGS